MPDAPRQTPAGSSIVPARRIWSLPVLRELPKLTDLTLTSAVGGGGGTGGGGSTVFGLLLAAGLVLLSACASDQPTEPGTPAGPKPLATISCVGDVAKLKVSCGSPQAAPGQEILGGQGIEIALRSSNIFINGFNEFTFDVSLQNLSTQRLGWDGSTPTGEEVFFVNGPTPDVGTMTVMGGSVGTFTAPGQAYYQYFGVLDPQQTTGTVNWKLHMSGGVTSFTFTVLVAADVFDQGGVLKWTPIDGTTQRWYTDVAVSSATDRMAVGFSGSSARYTGGKWVALPPVTTEHFNAVTAIAPGEYYAVTGSGAVFHFKNRVWTQIYHQPDYFGFYAIWAKDTSLIVAVGQHGTITRYSGGVWHDASVPTAASGDLIAVSGSADGSHISAVNGAFLNGQVWTSVAGGMFLNDPNFAAPFAGIGLDIAYDGSGNALLAYVDFGGPATGVIIRSTGDTLLYDMSTYPSALFPHGTNKVAVGELAGSDHLVADLDYTTPSAVTSTPLTGALPGSMDLAQLAPTNSGITQFEVISGSNGHLLGWDGATWTDEQGSGDWQDPDLWGIGDTLFALDGIGGFHKIVDGVMTTLPSAAGNVYRLWGISSTEFWAINATEAWHFDPVNGWTNEHTVPGGSDNRDVWVDPTGTSVIVLGENGEISSRISGVWTDQSIPRNVNAVWGCDAHTAWIVTQEGEIWKWIDGVVSLDVAVGPNPLRAINGNVFCDPWVAGDNGTMFHRLGGTWTNRFDPSAGGWTLRAVAIRGAGQTIAAGDNANYGLFSDASPLYSTPLPTQGGGIKALWRLSNGEVYAAGSQFLLRGSR